MASINATEDQEVSFISGITANGTLASTSFWTWNQDTPATYDSSANDSAKFGSSTPGTGATISYAFDPASHWTATEEQSFIDTAALWSAVTNVSFVEASSPASAEVTISRASDGTA